MAESKSAALPLGYAPTLRTTPTHSGAADHSGGALPDQRPKFIGLYTWGFRPFFGPRAPLDWPPMTLPRAGCRHRFCAQTRRRAQSRAGRGALWRSRRSDGRFGAGGSRPLRQRRDRAAQPYRRQVRHPVQGRRRHHAAGLERGLHRLGRRRLERACRARRMGRPGTAARAERGLRRDVEFGVDGLRHRPGADHGGDRCARRLWQRRPQAGLSRQTGQRRMDGHHAAHRAAGRLRCRRAAHQGASAPATAAIASPARRSSSPMASTT